MKETHYPLGHEADEIERLNKQAVLLHDPYLDQLARASQTCLEIGCGVGSNLPLLRSANAKLHYTGIDIAKKAIETAQSFYQKDKHANFITMNATDIRLDVEFDLIFTKLVLWSIGPTWQEVIINASRLLKPGGVFYALEPCNQLIHFYPPKPLTSKWMRIWDEAILQSGLNTYIGTEIAKELILNQFQHVSASFFPVYSLGNNKEKYTAIINNLKGFYLGKSITELSLNMADEDKTNITRELESYNEHHFVMDALYRTVGHQGNRGSCRNLKDSLLKFVS